MANQTEKPVFNPATQIYSRNSSITVRGFRPNRAYRFYCVRVSEQGIYARSVEITCVDSMYRADGWTTVHMNRWLVSSSISTRTGNHFERIGHARASLLWVRQ
jgi:hypothetical protein